MKLPLLALLLVSALTLAGCHKDDLMPNSPPEVIYKKAQMMTEDEEWELAKKYIDTLREEHPFSPYAVEGELLEADILFKEELYKAAIESYASFEELHPFHEKASYALYMRGVSNYELIDTEDRDITSAVEARRVLEQYIRQNPKSPRVADASQKLKEAVEILAEHEMYVAQYYERKDKPEAAIARLRGIVRDYPESALRDQAAQMVRNLEADRAAKK